KATRSGRTRPRAYDRNTGRNRGRSHPEGVRRKPRSTRQSLAGNGEGKETWEIRRTLFKAPAHLRQRFFTLRGTPSSSIPEVRHETSKLHGSPPAGRPSRPCSSSSTRPRCSKRQRLFPYSPAVSRGQSCPARRRSREPSRCAPCTAR